MESSDENVRNDNLTVNSESAAYSSVVVELGEMSVNGATAADTVSNTTGDKIGDEGRCKINDSVKYEWTDITSDFIGACSDLELGELVHDSRYGASAE